MKKNTEMHFRIDMITLNRLKERSRELGISDSEYLRRLILSDLYPVDQTKMSEIIRKIAELGNHINMLAGSALQGELKESDVAAIDGFRKELLLLKEEVQQLKKKIGGGG